MQKPPAPSKKTDREVGELEPARVKTIEVGSSGSSGSSSDSSDDSDEDVEIIQPFKRRRV